MKLTTALTGLATGLASILLMAGSAHAAPDNYRGDRDVSSHSREYKGDQRGQRGNHDGKRDDHRNPSHTRAPYKPSPDHGRSDRHDNRRYEPTKTHQTTRGYGGYNSGYKGHRHNRQTYPQYNRRYNGSNYGHHNGYNQRGGQGDLVLFSDGQYRGYRTAVNGNLPRLNDIRMNDRVSSIIVNRGTWEICTDSYFRGRCFIIDSSTPSLSYGGLNDRISSIRRVGGYGYGPRQYGQFTPPHRR